jgi:hypothetical protein
VVASQTLYKSIRETALDLRDLLESIVEDEPGGEADEEETGRILDPNQLTKQRPSTQELMHDLPDPLSLVESLAPFKIL